jgi:hypothetical protein
MSKARKHGSSAAGRRSQSSGGDTGRKAPKRPTNLTLDPEAVRRGERFGQRHGASLSQLVTGFLYSLPAEELGESLDELTPAVRRLYGLAAGGDNDRDAYRDHLARKYGAR